MHWIAYVRRAARPLRSRKLRVALTTVIAAFLTDYGFTVREELIYTILAVGAALILGIAHEDSGRAALTGDAAGATPPARPPSRA